MWNSYWWWWEFYMLINGLSLPTDSKWFPWTGKCECLISGVVMPMPLFHTCTKEGKAQEVALIADLSLKACGQVCPRQEFLKRLLCGLGRNLTQVQAFPHGSQKQMRHNIKHWEWCDRERMLQICTTNNDIFLPHILWYNRADCENTPCFWSQADSFLIMGAVMFSFVQWLHPNQTSNQNGNSWYSPSLPNLELANLCSFRCGLTPTSFTLASGHAGLGCWQLESNHIWRAAGSPSLA